MGAAALTVGAKFSDQMQIVQAVSGATGAQMDKLREQAKMMGSTTRYSASQAAEGQEALARAGFDTNEIMAALPSTLNLATAGSLDLGAATDIAAGVLRGFGLEADQTGRVSDVLAKTASSTKTNVAGLGESFKYAAPIANTLGISLEDTAAAVGILGNNSIEGGQAGNMLKRGLLNLSAPTKQQTDLMSELGISVFDTNGEMKDLPSVIGELENGLQGMSKQQKLATLSTLFGAQAVSAWSILVDEGSGALGELSGELQNSQGYAQEFADIAEDSLAGSMRNLMAALEGLAISFSELGEGPIRSLVDKITDLIHWFTDLSDTTKQWIIIIGGVVATIGPVLMIIGMIGQGVAFLSSALAFLFSPVGLIIAGFVALVAAGVALYMNWDTIKEKAAALKEAVVEKFTALKDTTVEKFTAIKDAIVEKWNQIIESVVAFGIGILESITQVWTTVKESTVTLVTSIAEWLVEKWSSIIESLTEIWNTISEVATTAWNTVKEAIVTVVSGLVEVLSERFGFIGDYISNIWDSVKEVASNAWEIIKNVVIGIVLVFLQLLTGKFDDAKESIRQIWENIKQSAINIWNAIKTGVSNIVGALKDSAIAFVGMMKDGIANIWNNLKSLAISIFENIKNKVVTAFETLKAKAVAKAVELKAQAVNKFNELKTNASTAISNLKTAVVTGFQNMVRTAIQKAIEIKNKVVQAFTQLVSTAGTKIRELPGKVAEGFSAAIRKAGEFVSQAVTAGGNLISGFVSGVTNKAKNLISAVGGAVGGAIDKAKSLLKIHSPSRVFREIAGYTVAGFTQGMDRKGGNMAGAVGKQVQKIADIKPPNLSMTEPRIDVAGSLARSNGQINSSIRHEINNSGKQPAYVNFSLGGKSYRGFVDDISNAQNSQIQLTESYL